MDTVFQKDTRHVIVFLGRNHDADRINLIQYATSRGKTNFWSFVLALFGVSLPLDTGFQGQKMPGAGGGLVNLFMIDGGVIKGRANRAQLFSQFDTTAKRFFAPGIPITPLDDARHLQKE